MIKTGKLVELIENNMPEYIGEAEGIFKNLISEMSLIKKNGLLIKKVLFYFFF